MQLKSGNMYSKMVVASKEKQVENMRKNLECHKAARKFLEDYKKDMKIATDDDLP